MSISIRRIGTADKRVHFRKLLPTRGDVERYETQLPARHFRRFVVCDRIPEDRAPACEDDDPGTGALSRKRMLKLGSKLR